MFGQLAVFDLRQVRGGCVPDATPGGRSVRSGRRIRCPLFDGYLRAGALHRCTGATTAVRPQHGRRCIALIALIKTDDTIKNQRLRPYARVGRLVALDRGHSPG